MPVPVMADSSEDLQQKHRQERKELQSRIQQLKHSVAKGDKRRKKEAAAEIAKLTAELEEKQEKESAAADSESRTSVKNQMEKLTVNSSDLNAPHEETETVDKQKKKSKAQKRREKKAELEKERERNIAEQEEENLVGSRNVEAVKLAALLASRDLVLHEVPSDGNCLYNAVSHQLNLKGKFFDVQMLRQLTSRYMASHPDNFLPFLSNTNTGEPLSADDYGSYCDDIANTTAWAGQPEIRAVTQVLETAVEILQADGPVIIIGEDFAQESLKITYHRHAYGLGEHYNSTSPVTETQDS